MAARNAGIRAKSGLTRLYGTSQRAGTATFKAAGIELFLSDKAKDINRNASLKMRAWLDRVKSGRRVGRYAQPSAGSGARRRLRLPRKSRGRSA